MSKTITKNLFLSALQCPTYGHLQLSQSQQPTSPSEQLRKEEGIEVQQRARLLHPTGVLVLGNNITASNITKQLIAHPFLDTIFEATFLTKNYVTKADILVRSHSKWKIIEIKSAVNQNDDHISDLAYTTMIARKAGLEISSCSLLLVNKEYRLGMNDEKLFIEKDITAQVLDRIRDFEESYDSIAEILSKKEKPDPEPKWECKGCEIFSECCGEGIENHIFDLPRISHTKYCQLRDMGIVEIGDIPKDFELTAPQEIVRKAVVGGEAVIDRDGLKEALGSIEYPCYYLDFETMQTAIPLYEGLAPYEAIPFQYSLHVGSEVEIIVHKEYLADPSRDCRRELAEKLIRDCGSKGSIVVYTSFEKTIIKSLAELFPDLKKELGKLIDRLVDLYKIVRECYYDPGFRGSYSIKNVLPVLVPELGYDNLEIDNGLDASAVFAFMAKGDRYSEGEVDRIRGELKEYCGRDTEAMVRVVERLREWV